MAKTPVFISFDYDNDATLKDFLVGQAKNENSPFEIVDHSVRKPLTGDWKEKVKGPIGRAKQMAVICGHNTAAATGVSVEIEAAREIGTPYFLLCGYADKKVQRPNTALSSDKIYDWTWPNLEALISGSR